MQKYKSQEYYLILLVTVLGWVCFIPRVLVSQKFLDAIRRILSKANLMMTRSILLLLLEAKESF